MLERKTRFIRYAIISSILSSIATLLKVQGVKNLDPIFAAAVGILFASLISLIFLFLNKQIPRLADFKKVLLPFIFLTICRPILSNILFTIGLTMTVGVKAVFITKMEPYLVLLWSWIIDQQKPKLEQIKLLFIHIFGAILLTIGDFNFSNKYHYGDLLILLASIMAALSYRFSPKITKVLTPIQVSTFSELIGGTVALMIAIIISTCNFQAEYINQWFFIAAHSILFYIIAMPLLYASLEGISAWKSSALRATGPLVAVPIAWFCFNEKLNFYQLIGAIIVLITSLLITREKDSLTKKAL